MPEHLSLYMNPGLRKVLCALLAVFFATGCASSPKTPDPVAELDSIVLDVEFGDAWQATKRALVREDYTIHTRDKRGLFIAHSDQNRRLLTPHRARITVVLDRVTTGSTRVSVEAIHERYGVTLLTFPDWREVPKVDESERRAQVLDAIVDEAAKSVETD